tara:strand:- start:38 stop:232 length:195 start_codon:yes stop_codon:yes gene_type:complete
MPVVAVVEQDVQEEAQEQVEQAVVVLDQKLQAQRQQELQTLAVVVAVVEHAVLAVDQVVLVVKE